MIWIRMGQDRLSTDRRRSVLASRIATSTWLFAV